MGLEKTNSSIDVLKGQISEDNIEGLRGVAHLRKSVNNRGRVIGDVHKFISYLPVPIKMRRDGMLMNN